MYYSEQKARELVIQAGHLLVEKKLISRTWGNISARISDTEFVITPSGMSYDTLTPDKLVVVQIQDCSYSGDIKPSSEKKIHACAYTLRPDVNFIIHTHQFYASIVGCDEQDTSFAPCASYGLPGTKKLMKAVKKSIENNPDKKAFFMAHHGALCLGGSDEDAFSVASLLEEESKKLYEGRVKEREVEISSPKTWLDDYAQIVGNGKDQNPLEDLEAVQYITEKNLCCEKYVRVGKPLCSFDTWLQHFVYKTKYSKLKDRK